MNELPIYEFNRPNSQTFREANMNTPERPEIDTKKLIAKLTSELQSTPLKGFVLEAEQTINEWVTDELHIDQLNGLLKMATCQTPEHFGADSRFGENVLSVCGSMVGEHLIKLKIAMIAKYVHQYDDEVAAHFEEEML